MASGAAWAGRARLGAICLGVVVATLLVPGLAEAARPNVVLVVTDDQTAAALNAETMPETERLLRDAGTGFPEAVVSTPQCCPSRATMLTGQYPHNNGVTSNRPGYPLLRDKASVLPAWLHRAGYTTIHVGKFLNGYFGSKRFRPAPGWDRWLTLLATDYADPVFSIDGDARAYSDRYVTRIINGMAVDSIRRYAPKRRPFYLQVDQFAPHVGGGDRTGRCVDAAVPDRRDDHLFEGIEAPRPPNFNEGDVSDKPEFIQALPRFGPGQIAEISRLYGCALASLRAVDRGVGRIVAELRRHGELGDTAIVFTSDNGYAFGEHRFPDGKGLAYEENLSVPLVIRPPASFPTRARSGLRIDAPVANVDLAPTILALAGARPCTDESCRRMDGRSLLGLLRHGRSGWEDNRAIRIGFRIGAANYRLSCEWEGLRTPGAALIRHTVLPDPVTHVCEPAKDLELYSLDRDPFQRENLSPSPPDSTVGERERALLRRLGRLRDCAGIRGRDRPLPDSAYCE